MNATEFLMAEQNAKKDVCTYEIHSVYCVCSQVQFYAFISSLKILIFLFL